MKIHLRLDIAGALMNWKKGDYARVLKNSETGKWLSPEECKRYFIEQLGDGVKYLPMGNCDGFSPHTGCPGHDPDESPTRRVL